MFAIGAAWLVSGFENIGTVNFRRNMDFAAEFRLLATKRVISFLVTMVAAVVFHSYWSLVIGMATGRFTGVVLSYLLQPFRPRLSLGKARELFSFSGWMLVSNLATVLLSRVPHIYVGRMFGAQTLGAYTVGSEIAQLAHTELVAPINRAMFPGYSRLTGDLALFRRTAVDATAAILLVVMPVSVGVAVLAAQMVRILLGAQWPEAAPVIEVLAFSGAVSALTSNNMSAYQALGRPHLCTVTLLARLVLVVGMMLILGSSLGVLGVAYAELIAALGSLAVSVPILSRTLKMPLREYWSCLWRPTIASGLMGAGDLFPDAARGRRTQLCAGRDATRHRHRAGCADLPAVHMDVVVAGGQAAERGSDDHAAVAVAGAWASCAARSRRRLAPGAPIQGCSIGEMGKHK